MVVVCFLNIFPRPPYWDIPYFWSCEMLFIVTCALDLVIGFQENKYVYYNRNCQSCNMKLVCIKKRVNTSENACYPNLSIGLLLHLSVQSHTICSFFWGSFLNHGNQDQNCPIRYNLLYQSYLQLTFQIVDFRLPPRYWWNLRSSGVLRCIMW
jgi:hypothetical protein